MLATASLGTHLVAMDIERAQLAHGLIQRRHLQLGLHAVGLHVDCIQDYDNAADSTKVRYNER